MRFVGIMSEFAFNHWFINLLFSTVRTVRAKMVGEVVMDLKEMTLIIHRISGRKRRTGREM
ncbi:hypothetical protein Bhyg_07671 [Pseudolycoriella hygida]|uniref:Uncharacterized protein n=1 Tax=Pseudolycoriella hygida TaxID=35572 RepID=A0A9Q0S279_9DIPT|nr:hypothetical protein Bhyg_07671 [Pseudolycoriella hygida]